LLKRLISAVKGVGIKELVANPSEKSLNFSTPSEFSGLGMDMINPEVGTDKFQIATVVAGTVIGVVTDRFTGRFDGGHEFLHHHLGILVEEESGVDHIAGGIVDNGIQIGLYVSDHPPRSSDRRGSRRSRVGRNPDKQRPLPTDRHRDAGHAAGLQSPRSVRRWSGKD